jgi:GT2 family glycosyltransferase
MTYHDRQEALASQGIDVTIIIVNWNSSQYLKACLSSIYDNVKGVIFEVIVVDNASYDGSADLVSKEFPSTVFIQSDSNLGFARANNLMYRQSRGQMILFLNPDTKLLDDAVTIMYRHLKRSPSVGAVSCRVLNSDLSPQTYHLQTFPALCNKVFEAEILKRLFSFWNAVKTKYNCSISTGVDVITASCLMVSRVAFEEVGLFDERYWLYGEDLQLCYDLTKTGYSVEHIDQGTVVHHGGASLASIGMLEISAVMECEAIATFFRRTRGSCYTAVYRTFIGASAVVRLVLLLFAMMGVDVLFDRTRLSFARRKWSTILCWSIGASRTSQITRCSRC